MLFRTFQKQGKGARGNSTGFTFEKAPLLGALIFKSRPELVSHLNSIISTPTPTVIFQMNYKQCNVRSGISYSSYVQVILTSSEVPKCHVKIIRKMPNDITRYCTTCLPGKQIHMTVYRYARCLYKRGETLPSVVTTCVIWI